MSDEEKSEIPKLQKMYDNPWLLLVAGLVVMFVFYTIWGMLKQLGDSFQTVQ